MPNSLEVREVGEQRGHGQVLGAKTKGEKRGRGRADLPPTNPFYSGRQGSGA